MKFIIEWIRKKPIAAFFIYTFAITWGLGFSYKAVLPGIDCYLWTSACGNPGYDRWKSETQVGFKESSVDRFFHRTTRRYGRIQRRRFLIQRPGLRGIFGVSLSACHPAGCLRLNRRWLHWWTRAVLSVGR